MKTSAGDFRALSPERQADYAAGMADGLALAIGGAPDRVRQLRTCLNGYRATELATLAARQATEIGGTNAEFSGARLIALAMIRECQLQGPPF